MQRTEWPVKFFVLLLVGCFAFSLIGCGNSSNTPGSTSTPTTTTPSTNTTTVTNQGTTSTVSTQPNSPTVPNTTVGLDGNVATAMVFAFACKSLTPAQVEDLAKKYGNNVLIGLDPSYVGSEATYSAAKKAGMKMHAYLGGPSGLTDGKWDPVERSRLVQNASKLGYDVETKEGMAAWNKEGWKKYTDSQLKKAKSAGFESVEIDNLDRGTGESSAKLIEFYKEYAAKFQVGEYPRLMMKNIDVEPMQAVSKAIGDGQLPRGMFADYHIWESNFGKNPAGKQTDISKAMGIQTIESIDTNNYSSASIPALAKEIWEHRNDPDSERPALW